MLFVLAGGKGSRLREAIGNTPKALASVNGIPFLELQILNWTQQGVSSFTFLIHHGAEYIIDFLKSVQDSGKVVFNFNYVIESQPFYTANPISISLAHNGTLINSNEIKSKLIKIFIHGFLHLLGFNHIKNNDYIKMIKEEKRIYKSVISKLN